MSTTMTFSAPNANHLTPNSYASNPYSSNSYGSNPYRSRSYPSPTASSYSQVLGQSQTEGYGAVAPSESYIHASEVVILEPQSFSDIPSAVQMLRSNQVVVLNLAKMANAEAQRSVDFIAGGAYMCQGSLEKIDINIFLFTPQNTNIRVQAGQDQDDVYDHPDASPQPANSNITLNPPHYFLTPRAS